MLFYVYLFISVIVVDCILSVNLFLEKKKVKKKTNHIVLVFSLLTLNNKIPVRILVLSVIHQKRLKFGKETKLQKLDMT